MMSHASFFGALAFLGYIEAFALVLNLLPIPGLDGFGIIRPWLPYPAQDLATSFGQSAILVVFIVLLFVHPISGPFFEVVGQVSRSVGIDSGLADVGRANMPHLP
jgi:Zn-dependent protease